jgi:thioredoxin reductase
MERDLDMPKTDTPRIAVLGAGPVGLEAALYARSLNLPVAVFERGKVGEHLRRWGHVRLFSPFGMNVTSLGRSAILADSPQHAFPADSDITTGREHLAVYLEPLAKTRPMRDCLRLETTVMHVGRDGLLKGDLVGDPRRAQHPFRLLLRDVTNHESAAEADVVLDCTGTYGQHRWMGSGGIPAPGEVPAEQQIAYGLEDILGERKGAYAGRNVLVIGGGYSAATAVCQLAKVAEERSDTWIIWLARGGSTQPIKRVANDPLRERDRLAVRANTLATRGEGNVEFRHQTVIDVVESAGPDKGFRVTGRCQGKKQVWDVDRIIANVGYTPDTDVYRELQVHECYATLGPMALAAALSKQGNVDCLQVPGQGAGVLRNPEPNFFILGAKSYGRNTNFLLRTGFDQVREVFTLLTGKAGLDLYKKR